MLPLGTGLRQPGSARAEPRRAIRNYDPCDVRAVVAAGPRGDAVVELLPMVAANPAHPGNMGARMTDLVLRLGRVVLVLALAACDMGAHGAGGSPGRTDGGARRMMAGGRMGTFGRADSAAAPRPAPARAAATVDCPAVDAKLVQEGRAIFAGPGNCQMCHGGNAKGTPLAPDLTDATWLNIDGSYGAIAGLVRAGVPRPKAHPSPMPPLGGASLTAHQVCAVAAYVYSLGHAPG